MNYELIVKWLSAWRVKAIALAVFCAAGGFALGVVFLILAWIFIYMLSVRVVGECVPCLGSRIHPLVATIAVPLLFLGNARVHKEVLGNYEITTGTATNKVVSMRGFGSNINPLAPNSIISVVKIFADILFCGPRTIVWALKQVERIFRLLRLDTHGCAAVLSVLYDAGQRMSYCEIAESIEGLNTDHVFNQLRLLDGVIFLKSEPPGLSLGSDWRMELNGILRHDSA